MFRGPDLLEDLLHWQVQADDLLVHQQLNTGENVLLRAKKVSNYLKFLVGCFVKSHLLSLQN